MRKIEGAFLVLASVVLLLVNAPETLLAQQADNPPQPHPRHTGTPPQHHYPKKRQQQGNVADPRPGQTHGPISDPAVTRPPRRAGKEERPLA